MMKNTMTRLLARVATVAFFVTAFSGLGLAATYSLTPNQASTGSESTTYITTLTEFTHSGITWKMNQWNPSSLQVKTNQKNASSEFRFYNTSAFPGKITQVVIKFSALTVSNENGFMFLGGTSEVTATSGGTSGTWNSTTKTITWTPGASDNYTFFAFYQNGQVASGSNYLATANAIVVTYENSAAATTTTISASGITNTDVYVGTAAGSLSASVTSGGNPVQGASVTWSGNNNSVATINASTGAVTLVAAGSVTFTASYAGSSGVYMSSSDTYELTVTNSTPKVNVTYKANGGTGSDFVEQPYQGSNYTIAGNTFTYAGRIFKKWNTAANGSGQDYAPGDVISGFSSDVTLFAQWQAFTYDFTSIAEFSDWSTSYSEHTVKYADATVVFASANKQSGTNPITDQPVTKGSDVELMMTDGSTIGSVVFVCKQWNSLAQTITLRYRTNSGSSYSDFTPAVTSSNFVLSKDDLPEGTNALKFSFSSSSNQVGITGIYIEKIAGSESSIILSPASVSGATSAALEGSIGIVFNELDIEDESDFDIQFYDSGDADNEIEAPSWVHLTIEPDNEDYKVSYSVDENLGSARAAYFKVYSSADLVYSNLVTISQAAFQMNYAALPFSYDGGKAGINAVAGFSQSGLGTDYASSPKLKFDGTGDYLLLQLNQAPGTVSFDIKGNSFSGGTFKVQTSANGVDYTDLEEYTSLSDKQSEALDLDYNVRFIKWVYTNKSDGNVALGNISVVAPASAPSTITLAATLADGRYWTTFYNGLAKYSLPSGAQAFKLNSSKQLYLVGDVIPKGNAVVIISNSASVQLTKVDASGSAIEGNILVGADTPTARGAIDGTPYVLGVQGGVLGFHKFTGSGVPAGKAYYIVNE